MYSNKFGSGVWYCLGYKLKLSIITYNKMKRYEKELRFAQNKS